MEKTQIIVRYIEKKLKKYGNTRYYLRCKECIKEFGE